MASKGRLVFKLSHTAWSFCWAVAPAPEGLQTCHGWWRNRPCSHYWQSLSWNFVWKLAVTYICTQTHIYISINILYIIYSTVSIYIYIRIYTHIRTYNIIRQIIPHILWKFPNMGVPIMIPNSSIFSIENYGDLGWPDPTGPPPGPHRAPGPKSLNSSAACFACSAGSCTRSDRIRSKPSWQKAWPKKLIRGEGNLTNTSN
jgi:hypothetical protein